MCTFRESTLLSYVIEFREEVLHNLIEFEVQIDLLIKHVIQKYTTVVIKSTI